ncbi:MAG: thioesterase [Clostridia bacterium]
MFTQFKKLDASYFDKNNLIKPYKILGLFEEVGINHNEQLDISFKNLFLVGKTWLIARTKFDCLKPLQKNVQFAPTNVSVNLNNPIAINNFELPCKNNERAQKVVDNKKSTFEQKVQDNQETALEQEVELATWYHTENKACHEKDFAIYSPNGELLIKGASKWCVFDRLQNKLCGVNCIVIPQEDNKRNYPKFFPKILAPTVNWVWRFDYSPTKDVIDVNNHINNVMYLKILEDILPAQITHLQIDYYQQCLFCDTLKIFSYVEDNRYYFKGEVNTEIIFTVLCQQ